MRLYSLDVKFKGSSTPFYTLESSLRDRRKRGTLMARETIQELDKLTALFDSFEDLNEEFKTVHGSNKDMFDPLIIVDVDEKDLSKSYAIFDIVYSADKKQLDDPDNIKLWLLEYLKKNPKDISRFKGIRNIYGNKYVEEFEKGIVTEDMINRIVLSYLSNPTYKKYRDIYFTLKRLDKSKVKSDEIHR